MMSYFKVVIGLSVICSTSSIFVAAIVPSAALCQNFPNEEYALDPYRCQEICEKYGDPSCPDYAPDGDCYCKSGYIRLETDGRCVAITSSECQAKLPANKEKCTQLNEQLREYLYDEPCPNTCGNFKVPCHALTPNVMIWSPHCVCKDGFSRLPNGICVPVNDPKCEDIWKPSEEQCVQRGNEIYNWGSSCQTTCEEIVTDERVKCTSDVIVDCYCPEGKVRFVEDGECVDIEDCFHVK